MSKLTESQFYYSKYGPAAGSFIHLVMYIPKKDKIIIFSQKY